MSNKLGHVTILILIDGFLQSMKPVESFFFFAGHNPYFNRWFSAIKMSTKKLYREDSHNPYFNRWFSAIGDKKEMTENLYHVTILILIDGFLQY